MTFAQRRNCLTTHFSERIPVVKRRISVVKSMTSHIVVGPVVSQAKKKTQPSSCTGLLYTEYGGTTFVRNVRTIQPSTQCYIPLQMNLQHTCHMIKVKVKQSRKWPGVAQRVPGGLGSQIFMPFGTWRRWGRQPHTPAAFTPRKVSYYSFSLGAASNPGPWCGRKEYITEKLSDTTGNRSQDRPTNSAAP
jgi:hypothetical protein